MGFNTIALIQSCFYVQIANVHFHHLELSLYIISHSRMITATHQCHHHQLRQKLIQHNIIHLAKRQSMILYKICLLKKNKKHPIQIIVHQLIKLINNVQTIVLIQNKIHYMTIILHQ